MAENQLWAFWLLRRNAMNQRLNLRVPLPPGRRRPRLDPLALTALVYLKEALLEERYEECAAIIRIALEFGAGEARVGYLLEDPRRVF